MAGMNDPTPPAIGLEALEAGLLEAGFNGQFNSFSAIFLGRFSNEVWRLDLDNGVRLIAKKPYRRPQHQDHPDVERAFYEEMAGRRNLPIPRFVADLNGVLIIEYSDLRPFSFREGVEADHSDAAIDALADWHAAWWLRPPAHPWLPDYQDPSVRQSIQNNYDRAWLAHGSRLLTYAPEFETIGKALVGHLAETLAPMAKPATLIHGDAHAENLPLTDQGALLLDWQDPRIANPGLDLAVFTTMSFPESQRAEREWYLLDRHSARLRELGCDWPDPEADYRLGVLRRAARIVEIADVEFSSLPWVFRRSAIAAVEHTVEDLIR